MNSRTLNKQFNGIKKKELKENKFICDAQENINIRLI